MRDPALLATTLCTIRRAGVATRATAEQSGHTWLAGSALLNGQAIQDLLEDGWLRRQREGDCLFIGRLAKLRRRGSRPMPVTRCPTDPAPARSGATGGCYGDAVPSDPSRRGLARHRRHPLGDRAGGDQAAAILAGLHGRRSRRAARQGNELGRGQGSGMAPYASCGRGGMRAGFTCPNPCCSACARQSATTSRQ